MPPSAPTVAARPLLPRALLFAVAFRLLPALLLPQTSFQPDEFYQSLEPAHTLVFGYGHLTWEWRDMPLYIAKGGMEGGWYEKVVVGGRMRGWIWPGVFALVYKGMQVLGLDERFLTLVPRLVGVIIAAMTDYITYLLAIKFLGPGAGRTAMLLSMTSLFNAHILPRALSTSPETLLTALALLYFPLPPPEPPISARILDDTISDISQGENEKSRPSQAETAPHQKDRNELDFLAMDRIPPFLESIRLPESSLPLSSALATLAVCIRPTTIPFWAYLGVEHSARTYRTIGASAAVQDIAKALAAAIAVFAASTGIDYAITGRIYFPILTFIHFNLFSGLSANYGLTTPLYHLTQSLPIMLFPIWYWFAKGFLASLLPSRLTPASLASLDRPACLRTLSRALTFAIAALSLSPHSEWRFLHPFLPPLFLFAIPPLFQSYQPVPGVVSDLLRCFRQYFRLSKRAFWLILFAPNLPFLYLNNLHGRAQVEVMNALRRGEVGQVTSLVALMPCHSTPWMSHLHRDVPAWFLTCEPPIGPDSSSQHHTQQSIFYDSPVSYLETVFPYPPSPLHKVFSIGEDSGTALPSHILLFGSLLGEAEDERTVKQALRRLGYAEAWSMWNGFDWAQDEDGKKGGVRVWRLGG